MSRREVAGGEILEALSHLGVLEGAVVVGDHATARQAIERLRAMLAGWGGHAVGQTRVEPSLPGLESRVDPVATNW